MYRGCQGHSHGYKGDDRGVQGVTGASSVTQGMYTGAQRGWQGIKGLCTGAHKGCTGDDSVTGGERGRQGIFIWTGVFRASSVMYSFIYNSHSKIVDGNYFLFHQSLMLSNVKKNKGKNCCPYLFCAY